MDLLSAQYAPSDEEGGGGADSPTTVSAPGAGGQWAGGGLAQSANTEREDDAEDDDGEIRFLVPRTSAAPPVSDALLASKASDVMSAPIDPSQRQLAFNPKFEQLWAPLEGPAHPHTRDGRALGLRNHRLGTVHDAAVDAFVFDEQYNTFQAYGYSVDPASYGGEQLVGEVDAQAEEAGGMPTVYNLGQQQQRKRKKERKVNLEQALAEKKRRDGERREGEGREGEVAEIDEEERRRSREEASEDEDEDKEEAGVEEGGVDLVNDPTSSTWLLRNTKSPWSGRVAEERAELTEEQRKYKEEHDAKKERRQRGEKVEEEEKSTFHGKEEMDYQGRSWIAPPKDAKAENEHCYIPKRCIHTWSGHTKGVSRIQFFPRTGHLLLSGSMDTKIKIWDVQGSKKCMRTYMGHSKAVKDISFSNDGTRFLSSSYDRKIKLWDTESGKVISTFSTGKIPYVVRLHPDDDKQNVLMAGMSDKKIMQWDTGSGEITQEYDQHLGAVNTITFFDDNRRFVTSSDDKSLRCWEWGIPVVVKYISEPDMHSMPAVTLSPNKHWVAAQSLDNQIIIYGTRDRFRLNRKKRFAGHVVAGYACQVGFSPDCRFVFSGDGEGRLWFWDWKTCKVFRTLKCHETVCIGCEWHPLEQSKVATCSWDGLIKYWD